MAVQGGLGCFLHNIKLHYRLDEYTLIGFSAPFYLLLLDLIKLLIPAEYKSNEIKTFVEIFQKSKRKLTHVAYLQLHLDLPGLPSGQNLDVTRHLQDTEKHHLLFVWEKLHCLSALSAHSDSENSMA